MKQEIIDLVKVSIEKSQGMLMEDILDAHLFYLTQLFASAETEEEGAGMALFKIFARCVNSDMKRNVERLVIERKVRNATVQNTNTKQE
jgi:hypothetical protein